MVIVRGLAAAIALLALSSFALADEGQSCLTGKQRRAVIASGQVMPLAAAIRGLRVRRSEVVKARLCRGSKGYVYLLTLLARDGKVTHVTVDAASGRLAGSR